MTRADLTAPSRPQAAAAASIDTASSRRRPSRRILAASVALALMLPTASAFAAETGTSNYNQTPPVKTTPSSGTGPSRSSSSPKNTATTPSTPTVTPANTSRSTLPFTGLDLRWIIAGGVLLMGAGLSLRFMQRKDASR